MELLRPHRALGRLSRAVVAAVLALVTLPIVLLTSSSPVSAGPPPVFTLYVPFTEAAISEGLYSILTSPGFNPSGFVTNQITITAAADNTILYWDHWEDGYESDIANPVAPTTTEIWGDGDVSNGAAPGVTLDADDVLNGGDVVTIEEDVPVVRNPTPTIYFDGRDKVAATRGIVMTRAGWDRDQGTVNAGAVAASDLSKYGTQFDIPIGENIFSNEAFEYTGMTVMASDDDTFVQIDRDGDGGVDETHTLDEGETVYVDGGMSAGGRVIASKPSQVHLLTGDAGSLVAGRWYEVFPQEVLDDEYVAAAQTTAPGNPVTIFVHNPNDATIDVAVNAAGTANDTTLSIVSGGTQSFNLPAGSGAQFSSPGNNFSAVSATVALAGNTTAYDWGYTLVPASALTSGIVVGWGAGNPDLTQQGSPVWVAPLDDTDLHVDYDGDGTVDNIITNVQQYASVKVTDPDFDMTGARIFSPTGVLLSAAWGQDPDVADPQNAFDLGTAILPVTSLVVSKDAALVVDVNSDGRVNPGDTLEYTITAVDAGALQLSDVIVFDDLPATLSYLPGTTTLNGVPVADDASGATVFPVDEGGVSASTLQPGESAVVAFRVQLADPFPLFTTRVRNTAIVTSQTETSQATSIVPVEIPDLYIAKASTATDPLLPGDIVTYEIDVANISITPQNGIQVTDTLPSELTWLSTSVTRPVDDTSPTGSLVATDDFDTISYSNDSADWATDWIETDTAGAGPSAGNVRIASELGSNRLRIEGSEQEIRRTIDATDYYRVSADFAYRRDNMEAGDFASFQISTTGGSAWIEIDRFEGAASDATYTTTTYDLTRFSGQPIVLRWITSQGFEVLNDRFFFDDVDITMTKRIDETVPGQAPGTLYTNGELLTGESLTVTVTAQLDPSISPTTDSITNTASTSSTQSPTAVESTATDQIARASIGDTIWHDLDGDRIVDAGEPLLAGVEVTLFDSGGGVVASAITDSNGEYLFDDLDPADYTVTVTNGIPVGMVPTFDADGGNDETTDVVAGFGDDDDTIDFAYAFVSSLGDRVYADLDGDSIENGMDFGIDGLTVTITGTTPGASHPGGSTTATVNGDYSFTGLLPGTYEVTVDTSPLSTANYSTTGGDTQTHVIVSGTDVDDADFGYVLPASIGDLIWHDLDGDGVFDVGEPPFAGVDVTITGPGLPVGGVTRQTDANGYYLFSNLDAGTFTVTVALGTGDLPAGYDSSTGGATQAVTVGTDEQNDLVDFGFYTLGSIGDLVFDDRNGNGAFDLGESGLASVDVTITGTTPGASHPGGLTIQTDVNGNYLFSNLEPGSYTVVVDDSGFDAGTRVSLNGADPIVVIESDEDVDTADFGYVFPASIGDFVFHDLNGNGAFDVGEPGIDGVELELTSPVLAAPITATTQGGGGYLFSSLDPGDYTVTLDVSTLPAGYALTTGSNVSAVTIVSGSVIDTVDFGADTTADIGDLIFHDLDKSGTYDVGEPVLTGVEVTLTGGALAPAGITDTTDGSGLYLFENLDPGTYTVTVNTATVPAGYTVTTGSDSATTTLESAADDLTLDFGYATSASLGDLVWDDLDGDGVFDVGEPGIGGVDVTITGTSAGASHPGGSTVTTALDGSYGFASLEPGDYTVTIAMIGPLAGAENSAGGTSQSVTLLSTDDDDTVDFGVYYPATIGDLVWDDLDGDGVVDAGEPGLPGVTMTLTGGDLAAPLVDVTDADGLYGFGDLPPGDYTVTLTRSDIDPLANDTGGGTAQNVTITSGTDVLDADFGWAFPASVGDLVFDDLDGDGVRDAGEPGIASITVTLYSGGSALPANEIRSVTTDAIGRYSFDDLTPGTYTVEIDLADVDLPANSTLTTPAVGTTFTTTVASGGEDLSLDFGVASPITIGDFVFEDVNGNGVFDAGEPGLNGIDVTITGPSHPGGTTVATVNGVYEFTDLLPGDYDVVVDVADVTAIDPTYVSTSPTTISATYESGDAVDTVDFGFARPVSIGDFVFDDANGDGDPTGDGGLAGVTLELSGPGVAPGTTVVTDGTGAYSFDDLAPGTYTVTVTDVPAGYTNTLGGASQTTTVTSGNGDDTLDFGYYLGASLGDEIFEDLNGDGDRDAGEPGFDGVVVTLTGGSLPVGGITDTTDASGAYDFTGLEPGSYTVTVTSGLPAGVVNTLGGASQNFTVVSGDDENGADFGYYLPGSIGDYVFDDLNGNGLQDDGAPAVVGLSGVTVTLDGVTAAGPIATQTDTTDANGAYSFGSLAPGTYEVSIDTADLAAGATSTTGGFTISTIVVESGDDDDTIDFGVAAPASIGDLVFFDNDGSGTFNAGDTPVDGATVTLTGGDLGAGSIVATTGADGLYSFDALVPGDYTVTVTATGDLDGDEFSTTGGSAQNVTVASGDDVDTVDFGFAEPASIGDTLFVDTNGNGVQDGVEPGIADVDITITGTSAGATHPGGFTVSTGPTGGYAFTQLAAGDYTITVDTSDADFDPSYVSTTGGDSQTRTLAIGQNIDTVDFGYAIPVTIGDFVFTDDDADGDQTGESGLGGVTLELRDGATVIDTATSAAGTGAYSFDDVMPGSYTVVATGGAPAGAFPTTTGGNVQSVTVTSGNDDLTIDFGYAQPATIGNQVYVDANANGTFDAGDTGFQATVTITGPSHPAGQAFPTASDGTYSITGLTPGSYDLVVSGLPGNATQTEGDGGQTIVVGSNDTDNTADFGFHTPGSIGDLVFEDLDGDGVQDAGEPGYAGVTLELTGPGVPANTTVTTDGTGAYSFGGLAPGDYDVTVLSTPAGAVNTLGGTTQNVTVTSGQDVDDVDFGYYEPSTLGDFVFDDLNGNGLQDDGAPSAIGISGVDVTLTGTTAAGPIAPITIQTGANGDYDFGGLAPGTYTVTVDTADLPAGSTSTTGGFAITNIVVTSGSDTDTADFGVAAPANLGDLVFEDVNGNGIFDAGTDTGFESVTLTVTGTSPGASFPGGTTVTTGTTAGGDAGEYGLGGLLPGTYEVEVTPGTGTLPADGISSTGGNTQTITLASGDTDLDVDFGYSVPAFIGDQLFVDNNANGVFDAGDTGIAGVDVVLTGPGQPVGGTVVTTDVDGLYGFADLAPGAYTVTVDTADPQYVATFPGGGELSSTGGSSQNVTLTSTSNIDTVDFGWYQLGSIGDFVFDDTNGDGDEDAGEPGLDGVTVTLDGGDLVAPITTTTGTGVNAGDYTFPGLTPGTYTVTVDVPGSSATTPGGTTQTIVVASGGDITTADFGFAAVASIGDTVFHDLNDDGDQDAGEPGLAGVTITITGPGLPVGGVTDVTDGTGTYGFDGLVPGDYVVTVDTADLPSVAYTTSTGGDSANVTLASGIDRDDVDFGYSAPASIGDLVFDDLDGDGVFDAGEPGLSGVVVRITGGDLPVGGITDTTDGSGAYAFSGLTPGAYTVEIVSGLPAGAVTTLGAGGIAVTVESDETNDDIDFAAYVPTSIGDFVFIDEDGNGTFNGAAGDTALAGVEVTLTGGALPPAGITETTDASGLYSFDGLPPGDYTVTITDGTPPGSVSTTGGNATNLTLVSGTPRTDIDFGLAVPITIGDFVFDDLDGDGLFDAGEPGLDGVDLELVDSGGTVIDTATTAGGGAYSFTGVDPHPLGYTVRLATPLPAGYSATTAPSLLVTATSGDDVTTADFGLAASASIGDYVFDDLNGNGLQDDGAPADRGISGLTVTLTGGNLPVGGITDVTDANGAYLFDDLDPGDYVVTVSGPAGSAATTAGGDSQSVTVQSSDVVDTIDFGYAFGASIGDRIWNDLDADGIDDTEPGLAGVDVILTGNGVNRTETTDGSGNYVFAGLAPGEYTVTVDNSTIPTGANSGTQLAPTTAVSTTLTVQSGDTVDTVDYGYATTASIGDLIFDDLDGDGSFDLLEPGLDGVEVELLDGATVIATTTTVNGAYGFDGLAPGTYTVRVNTATLPDADASQTTPAAVATVTVSSDDENLDVDLGFARPAAIGDTIWHDLDADGTLDAGEPGLAGVKVDVFDGPTLVASDTTDVNGAYQISGLAPGTYTVQVDPSTIPTGVNSGTVFVASAGVPTSVVRTVESGDTANDADFAFHTTASIGDMVFHDRDADGLENDGAQNDLWLDSVVVDLIDPSDSSVVATTTTTGGAYSFTGLAPGTYEVRVDETTVPTDYVTTTGNPITIAVASDDAVDDVDFGYAELTGGAIGDEVFDDLNGDGVRQAGEPGITVTIELVESGVVVDRVTTNGGYSFINLPPGSYTVQVDPTSVPAGYISTTPASQTYTVNSGDAPITTADFGFVAPATVGDYIWHDLNGDGIDNDGPPADRGLAGITVELRDGATVVDSAVTAADGSYTLTAGPGTYDVVVVDATVPNGANSGVRMTPTTPSSVSVTLNSNDVVDNVDVGYATTASIGDTIFDDLDGDGVQDPGEPGLPGVDVELFDGTTTTTATTDADGLYSFDGLAPGDYTVTVDPTTLPVGSFPTTTTDPVDVTVLSDDVVDNVDLGFTVPGSISGEVFTDTNGDGLQTGEPTVDGIDVELLDDGGNVVDTVTTVGGTYTFTGVVPGDYTVRPVLPAGTSITVPNAGGDDAIDSDIEPTTGESGVITMTSGADIADVDAGIYEPATIGDTVFVDLDGDGLQGADEPGLAGAEVTVRDDLGNVIGSAITDANGEYSIDVAPGTHTVTVDLPTGYAPGVTGDVQTVTITSGSTDDTVDFAAVGANDISGSIIYDVANDGSIDIDDPGLGDVTVTATWNGPDGPVVFTTTTDPDGSYVFAALPPGDFTVEVDPTTLPDGIVEPTVDPDGILDFETDVTVGGTSVADVDFGVSGTASLGDNVFLDTNGNGVLDDGEIGVGGVTVTATITTSDGVRTYTTVTDSDGNYQFTDLPAGTYTITIDTATVPAGMVPTVLSFTTTLSLNGVDLAVDFPVQLLAGPIAVNDTATTPFDTPVVVSVTDNDSFEPGVTVTITRVGDPDNGTVTINDDGTITYTPDDGFTGTESFDYEICDLDALNAAGDTPANRAILCSTAIVTVTVGSSDPVTPTDPGTPVPPVTPPSTPTTPPPSSPTGDIPRTGSEIGGIQRIAALVLLSGLVLLLATRRRRRHDRDGDDDGIDMSTRWPAPTI